MYQFSKDLSRNCCGIFVFMHSYSPSPDCFPVWNLYKHYYGDSSLPVLHVLNRSGPKCRFPVCSVNSHLDWHWESVSLFLLDPLCSIQVHSELSTPAHEEPLGHWGSLEKGRCVGISAHVCEIKDIHFASCDGWRASSTVSLHSSGGLLLCLSFVHWWR